MALFAALFGVLSAIVVARAAIYESPEGLPCKEYDFIIIGGGTAGCVLAEQLSKTRSVTVLLVEAGISNTNNGASDSLIQTPFFVSQASPNTLFDWNYTTTAQTGLGGRNVSYPRGYVLGGSSSINFMVYARPSSDDFDRLYSVTGDIGWSWKRLLPYFIKTEKHVPPSDNHNTTGQYSPEIHGLNGKLLTSLPGGAQKIDDLVLQTVNQSDEFTFNLDMSSGDPLGIGWMQSTLGDGFRSSAATAFLKPAISRKNLDILTLTRATRLIQNGTQDGRPYFNTVEVGQTKEGVRYNFTARSEIILSAGTIGTPQLLIASGIGDTNEIQQLGLNPVVNLPDVGKNLQDHPFIPFQWHVNNTDTLDALAQNFTLVEDAMKEYQATRTGVLANNAITHQLNFARLPPSSMAIKTFGDPTSGSRMPHYVFTFSNGFVTTSQPVPTTGNYITAAVALVAPQSRGSVTLHSSSVFDDPDIDPALFGSEFDVQATVEATQSLLRFFKLPAWDNYILQPANISLIDTSEAGIRNYIQQWGTTIRHPVGTAAISRLNDTTGVVTPDLILKNASGVRIIDASIFPFAITTFPQASVYALAERAADLIKAAQKVTIE